MEQVKIKTTLKSEKFYKQRNVRNGISAIMELT